MSTLPSPPFLHIEGIANFRDIGGYASHNSPSTPSIRRHYLYRSADPSHVTAAGKAAIRKLGITTVFDLRSKPEIEKTAAARPVAQIEGVTRFETPAFADQDYGPEAIAERYRDYAEGGVAGFTRAYADILSSAGPAYRTILLHIIKHPTAPLLIHCSAGKDRTGIIIALILSISGASDETIADEYDLTVQGLGELREAIIKHLLESPSLGGDRGKAEGMVAAKKEYMLSSLQMIREKYGGPVGYVKQECGLSDENVATLRKNMVSEDAPILWNLTIESVSPLD